MAWLVFWLALWQLAAANTAAALQQSQHLETNGKKKK